MKRNIIALGLACVASGAVAAEVAPGDVAFEYGAVEQSLTGQPGDAENGREVVMAANRSATAWPATPIPT